MHWKATTALICVYGILKEFRPATPFLTPYLTSDYKNFTVEEVYGKVFPYWTYSYMIFLVPIFILTDILRYKPIIALEGACLSITWALLVWGQGIFQMQLMQIAFGLASAAEIAYYSYLYAIVDEKNYKRVTSYIRSAALVGKLLSYGLAQILVSTKVGSYLFLNQISLGAVIIVFFIALSLPRVPPYRATQEVHSELVEAGSQPGHDELTRAEVERHKLDRGVRNYLRTTVRNFRVFKESSVVLKWSIWWALASCGIYQMYNYIQALWLEMQPDPTNVENGLTEFANTLIGAILAFVIQFASIDWHKYGELTIIVTSVLIAVILVTISQVNQVVLAYVGYVSITAIYHALITAARFSSLLRAKSLKWSILSQFFYGYSCNIATELTASNYGLVFGWNTFVAVVLQTFLTFIVTDSRGLNLDIRTQFVVYGSFFAVIGALFLVSSIVSRFRRVPEDDDAVSDGHF
ncbi:reduced folate carrier [Oesophagostomum dentatum]|uniref:Reduced folate carrier n=1 Tax=Oesophagostomum dentatum TaxID=61180 RepID=A0A0B1TQJ9_OESDE|nr:reduced folate carrier [Oesophagostomum dentatum]